MKSLLLMFVGISIFNYSCTNADATKRAEISTSTTTEATLTSLKDAGFVNVPMVINKEATVLREKWKRQFNLLFISDVEAKQLLEENDFIIGPSSRYIKDIPDAAANDIAMNFNILRKSNVLTYTAPDGRVFTQEELDDFDKNAKDWILTGTVNNQIFVIGPASNFNTDGMVITDRQLVNKKLDPIAVMKVDKGYVQIAKW
jgi:hypothetical protein